MSATEKPAAQTIQKTQPSVIEEILQNANRPRKFPTQSEFDLAMIESIRDAYYKLPLPDQVRLNSIMMEIRRSLAGKIGLGEQGLVELIGKIGVLLFIGIDDYEKMRSAYDNDPQSRKGFRR